jgi:ABC-type transport system involved in multi-copper enzyme maturation permease subunit
MARLLAGELTKVSTTRLWVWLALAAMALTALYAGLNIAFTDDPENFAPHLSTAQGQRLLVAIAATPATTFVAVLAAVGVTGEYRHGTATTTFLATPHRWRVVGAKLALYSGAGLAYAAACLAVVLVIGMPWLSSMGIEFAVGGNGLPQTIVGVLAAGVAFGLLGVALGALLREQVATVVGLLVYRFVAEPIVTSIPALDEWTQYLPGPATSGLTGSTLEIRSFLEPWQGGLVLAGYVVVLVAAGVLATGRRDVS